jgi:hypothetical protein
LNMITVPAGRSVVATRQEAVPSQALQGRIGGRVRITRETLSIVSSGCFQNGNNHLFLQFAGLKDVLQRRSMGASPKLT